MNRPLFIVAGTHLQATYYARHKNLGHNDWVHVHSDLQLLGQQNFRYVLVGTWRNLREATRILDRCRECGVEVKS